MRFAVVLYPVDEHGAPDLARGLPVGGAVEVNDITSRDEVTLRLSGLTMSIADYILVRQPWQKSQERIGA